MTESPDLIQPVVGFRAWALRDGSQLFSAGMGETHWLPGTNRAKCKLAEVGATPLLTFLNGRAVLSEPTAVDEHSAPATDCQCGLYCFHRFTEEMLAWSRNGAYQRGEPIILGAVVVWGNLEVHRTGIRAEFSRITTLGLLDRAALEPEFRQDCERAAARYGAKLVPLVDLEEEGLRHGIRMPDSLLPDRDEEEVLLQQIQVQARVPGFALGKNLAGLMSASSMHGGGPVGGGTLMYLPRTAHLLPPLNTIPAELFKSMPPKRPSWKERVAIAVAIYYILRAPWWILEACFSVAWWVALIAAGATSATAVWLSGPVARWWVARRASDTRP